MKTFIGIFPSPVEADGAAQRLRETGIAGEKVIVISPETSSMNTVSNMVDGFPHKRAEYEEALWQGHALLLVEVPEGAPADAVEIVLQQAGVQRLDAARQH